jgi:hypothetical protein
MTLANNVFYIKNIRAKSCYHSVGARILGRTFYMTHKAYDTATSVLLFATMMILPVAMVALEVVA